MFVPVNDAVVVRKKEPVQETKAGLIVPVNEKLPIEGEVLSVSKSLADEIGSGDTILFYRGLGEQLSSDDAEVVIIKKEDILARKV